MKEELKIFLAVFPVAILLLLLTIFLRRCCCNRRTRNLAETHTNTRTETLQSGISKLHLSYNNSIYSNQETRGLSVFHHQHPQEPPSDKRRQKPNYYVIRRGVLTEPLFNWADHPRLISEAVENGWPRFAFAALSPSLPRSKSVWEFCAVCDYGGGGEGGAEISWEVSSGSSDCMQKIKLNPRSKENARSNGLDFGHVRMELPLPGPPLGNSSFPQEAYFEISILSGEEEEEISGLKRSSASEGEQVKLISEIGMKTQSDDSLVDEGNGSNKKIEKKKDEEGSLISLGLDGGAFPPFKLPGTYPGSIGFNSNGSVYLDGIKLVFEAKEGDWRGTNRVIGCGFDPGRKRVFFTVDSKLVHVIHCKPEEFGSPLYPILASNADITVLVNMGQTSFKYAPANPCRTPNPCFFRPIPDTASPALRIGCEEDSRELFSMGRIDSKWLGSRNKNGYGSDENTVADVDSEIDDLFEIVLDDRSKSR